MGSPLAPTLANLFMGVNETNWLSEYEGVGPKFYRRYVDDIFAVFEHELEACSFFEYLNSRHPNIKFTKEYSKNGTLPFLDVSIYNMNNYTTSVYHKSTYTGLLLNFKSFVPFEYKIRLIKTLLDRIFRICTSWVIFDLETKKLTKTLLRNMYPIRLINKQIKRYLDSKFVQKNEQGTLTTDREIRNVTLPYIGKFSDCAKKKINKLVSQFCNQKLQIRLVFTTCKLKSYFSNKDILPKMFTSFVVYHFKCAGCNSSYVGRTHVHYDKRCEQHLESDVRSSVFKHINANATCKKSDYKSFNIIDRGNTDYTLAIKEGMHIKWLKPNLNTQKHHIILKLLV